MYGTKNAFGLKRKFLLLYLTLYHKINPLPKWIKLKRLTIRTVDKVVEQLEGSSAFSIHLVQKIISITFIHVPLDLHLYNLNSYINCLIVPSSPDAMCKWLHILT